MFIAKYTQNNFEKNEYILFATKDSGNLFFKRNITKSKYFKIMSKL